MGKLPNVEAGLQRCLGLESSRCALCALLATGGLNVVTAGFLSRRGEDCAALASAMCARWQLPAPGDGHRREKMHLFFRGAIIGSRLVVLVKRVHQAGSSQLFRHRRSRRAGEPHFFPFLQHEHDNRPPARESEPHCSVASCRWSRVGWWMADGYKQVQNVQ